MYISIHFLLPDRVLNNSLNNETNELYIGIKDWDQRLRN